VLFQRANSKFHITDITTDRTYIHANNPDVFHNQIFNIAGHTRLSELGMLLKYNMPGKSGCGTWLAAYMAKDE